MITGHKNNVKARRTDDCIRNKDMEEAVAVEVELKKRRYSLARCDSELSVAVCAARHIDTVSQKVECSHHHVLRVPRKAQIKVP